MTEPQYNFDPLNLPSNLRAAIGLAVAAASQTEDIINQAIGGCLGIDGEYTIAVTQHMPIPLKLSVLYSAAEIRLDDLDDLDKLDELLATVKDTLDKRNAIVHDSWAVEAQTRKAHRISQKARVRVEAESNPITVDEVVGDAVSILDAGLALYEFFSDRNLLPQPLTGMRPRGHKSKAARKARRAKSGK
jgi:hypothetical protein